MQRQCKSISNHHEICSLESFSSCGWLTTSCFVYIRLPLWHHHACVATYSPRKAALIWSWWYGFNCFKNEWKFATCFCVRSPGWTTHHALVRSPGRRTRLPVRGGASNHGSLRKIAVNSYTGRWLSAVYSLVVLHKTAVNGHCAINSLRDISVMVVAICYGIKCSSPIWR